MQSKGTVLYGGKTIAEYLGIPQRHVYAMADAGRLPTFRSGATICSTVEVLDEWRRAREAEARRAVVRR